MSESPAVWEVTVEGSRVIYTAGSPEAAAFHAKYGDAAHPVKLEAADIDAVEVTTPIDPSVPDESANDEPDALPEPTDEQAPAGPKNEPIPEEAI